MLRRKTALAWCSVVILSLSVCLQLLGVPGTLFNVSDSEDDFQASVMTGYSIITGTVSQFISTLSFLGFADIASLRVFSPSHTFFHPPISFQLA